MKKVALGMGLAVGLFCRCAVAQTLEVVAASPAPGSVGVAADTSVTFTFSAPLDTSAHVYGGGALSVYASGGLSTDAPVFGDTLKRVTYPVQQEAGRDYVWIVQAAVGQDSVTLPYPYVLRYTTDTAFGERTVTGDLGLVVAVKRDDDRFSPRHMVVALLSHRPDYYSAILLDGMVAATTGNEDGTYQIDEVRPGVYWPVAVLDNDLDGDYNWVGSYRDRESGADSIVVGEEDVSGVEIVVSGGAAEEEQAPRSFRLEAPYPNPTDGAVRVCFSMAVPGVVDLDVFNALGQRVGRVMAGRRVGSGSQCVDWNAGALASGAYLFRLRSRGRSQVRPFVVRR